MHLLVLYLELWFIFLRKFFENLLTPLGSISFLISTLLIFRSYISVKKALKENQKKIIKIKLKKAQIKVNNPPLLSK